MSRSVEYRSIVVGKRGGGSSHHPHYSLLTSSLLGGRIDRIEQLKESAGRSGVSQSQTAHVLGSMGRWLASFNALIQAAQRDSPSRCWFVDIKSHTPTSLPIGAASATSPLVATIACYDIVNASTPSPLQLLWRRRIPFIQC